MLNLQLLNPNRIQIVTFLPYNMQTIEHQLLTKTDAEKWATITRENIGKRLALFVNDQLMNAPKVNSEIESGRCSVSIPANMVKDFLPNIDLEKIKQ